MEDVRLGVGDGVCAARAAGQEVYTGLRRPAGPKLARWSRPAAAKVRARCALSDNRTREVAVSLRARPRRYQRADTQSPRCAQSGRLLDTYRCVERSSFPIDGGCRGTLTQYLVLRGESAPKRAPSTVFDE